MHYAIENENVELVHLLLSKCNANPLVQNYAGQTSCSIAGSLCKRNPSKKLQDISDLLRKYAEKWDSASEYESDSSSDEVNNIFFLIVLVKLWFYKIEKPTGVSFTHLYFIVIFHFNLSFFMYIKSTLCI